MEGGAPNCPHHYNRRCAFKMSCCDNSFGCLRCHDEASAHRAARDDIIALICSNCKHEQKIQGQCVNCLTHFGKYNCSICAIFDDECKGQYHCEACGLCRIGGQENFFHCATCDMCLPKNLENEHKCVEKISRSNCPVCQKDLHSSNEACQIPPCLHILHKNCFDNLISSSLFYCPICFKSLCDLSPLWKLMRHQIEKFPMTGRFEKVYVHLMCRDCNQSCLSNYHVIGVQCANCWGFNTVRTNDKYLLRSGSQYEELDIGNY